jgi:hypothetical protein
MWGLREGVRWAYFSEGCPWGGGRCTAADIYSAEEDGDDAAVALVRVSFSGIDLVMLQV